jgi:PAS domain S-box-containing protein
VAGDLGDQQDSELRRNEERLRLAIEATGIGTWDVNALTGEREWSREFRAILGLPDEVEADPELFASLLHPDDRDWVNEEYRAAYRPGGSGRYEVECRIRRFDDGSERWVLIKGQVSYRPDGQAVRGVGTLLDITDGKRTEAALAESEERYRLAVTSFHGAAYETDLDTGYAYRAPRAYEMLGVRPEDGEPTREWWFSRIHPDDAPRFHHTLEALFAGKIPELDLEFRMRHANGSWVWVWQRGLAVRDATGRVRRTAGAILDVTRRKQAEAALRESEARFRHMADSAPALIWMTDTKGEVTFANMHFDYVFGRAARDLLGQGWRSVVHPDDIDAFSASFLKAFKRHRPFRAEVRIIDRDGAVRSMRCDGVARTDDGGTFLGYTGCAVDVSDVKIARERQQLLIHELNHRVKNTLAIVQSVASQTLRNAAHPDQAKQAFEARLMALARAHDVLTRERWEGAALGEIVEQAIEPYRSHGPHAFSVSGPVVRLAPSMALAFAMALQELATNAVKYGSLSRPTGQVEITWSVEPSASPMLRLSWRESGGPPVKAPKRRGFGSRLIERSLAEDQDGRVKLTFAPDGLVCEFQVRIGEQAAPVQTT